MSEPTTSDIEMNKREEQRDSDSVQTVCNAELVRRFMRHFSELEWHDRLNLAFSAVLGLVLVTILSPILVVSWVCLLLAKWRTSSKHHTLAFRSQQP
jgi:hypothetical protein